MNVKKGIIFAVFLMGGILLGSVLTQVAEHVSWLSWLTWGKSIGIGVPNPCVVDLSVITFSFGFSLQMNLAILFCLAISMVAYHTLGKRI